MSRFSLAYRHNCKHYDVTLDAEDWQDAERHLASIAANGRIDGRIVAEIPFNDVTRPVAGMLARLILWWKTL